MTAKSHLKGLTVDNNDGKNNEPKKQAEDVTSKSAPDKKGVTKTAAVVESKPSTQKEKPPEKTVEQPATKKASAPKSAAPAKKTESTLPEKKASSGSSTLIKVLLTLCFLLLLAAVGMLGWRLYQVEQSQPVAQPNPVSLSDIQHLEQLVNEERIERQQQQAVFNQGIDEFQLTLNSHARRLRDLSTTSRTDWLLAEAEYLIRLANQRLITERNTKNAISLLVSADAILRDLDEVDLLPVRGALAKSITSLRTVPLVDREGLYLQLDALSEQLVKLPLIAPELDEPTLVLSEVDATENAASSELVTWKERLSKGFHSALESASGLIRVNRRDVPVSPLPSAEEEQYLRHNLVTLLEQAQMALLREEQVIYEASLSKARMWLNDYFELNDAAVQLVEQIKLLEEQEVVQQLPDISEGLEVLRDYIDGWHKRHVVQEPSSSEVTPETTAETTGAQQ
jgi:uroporphyrin-3 C-methyltransferase